MNIIRLGGLIGDVIVNFIVVYILFGISNFLNEVVFIYSFVISIVVGFSSVFVVVEIVDDGFIKFGVFFKVELIFVSL